jgi:pellino protein
LNLNYLNQQVLFYFYRFWSNVGIPYGTNGFEAFCPFCATLLEGYPGYVKLIFN